MKTILTTIALLYFNSFFSQDFIGKEWHIDNFLGEYPEATDVYYLEAPDSSNTSNNIVIFNPDGTISPSTTSTYQMVGKNYIVLSGGSYYLHKVSENEYYLVKSTGNLATDKQKVKDAEALARFVQLYGISGKSPNPSFQLKSDVPKDERIGKLVRKLFHLTSYEIFKTFPSEFDTLYLVKDLKTNTYYYLREEYYANRVTTYYYTAKDLKKRAKERKKQR